LYSIQCCFVSIPAAYTLNVVSTNVYTSSMNLGVESIDTVGNSPLPVAQTK